MARVLALVPDLLFGSRLLGALTAAGHEVDLVTDQGRLRERLAGGGVAEAVRHQQPPVPVVMGVGLGVAGHQVHGRLHVARLVGYAQVELEVGPVVGKRVHDLLEVVGQAHLLGA